MHIQPSVFIFICPEQCHFRQKPPDAPGPMRKPAGRAQLLLLPVPRVIFPVMFSLFFFHPSKWYQNKRNWQLKQSNSRSEWSCFLDWVSSSKQSRLYIYIYHSKQILSSQLLLISLPTPTNYFLILSIKHTNTITFKKDAIEIILNCCCRYCGR